MGRLLISEHVSGGAVAALHHQVMCGLGALPAADNIVWYAAAEDMLKAVRLFGSDVPLKHLPPEVSDFLSSQLVWQALKHRADAVLVIGGHGQEAGLAQLSLAGVETLLWAVDDPHELSRSLLVGASCNTTLTTEPLAVVRHRNGVFFPHAAVGSDIAVTREHAKVSRVKPPDILVVGSPYMNRVEWLNAMVPVLESNAFDVRFITHREHKNFHKLDYFWKAKSSSTPVQWNDLLLLYATAKCVLNIHRSVDSSPIGSNLDMKEADGLNQACFVVPSVGGTLLCDASRKQGILKQLEGHVLTFATPQDMAEYAVVLLSAAADAVVAEQQRQNALALEVIEREHIWEYNREPFLRKLLAERNVVL
jgi:hypothetical protein